MLLTKSIPLVFLPSKKPLEKRHKELSEAVSPGLIKYVSDNIKDLMCDRSLFVLVESVMMFGSGDLSSALKALIHEVALPFTKGSKEQKKNVSGPNFNLTC